MNSALTVGILVSLVFVGWRWLALERDARRYAKRLQRMRLSVGSAVHSVSMPSMGDLPHFPPTLTLRETEQLFLNDAINRFSADYVALLSWNSDDNTYQVLLSSRKNIRGDRLRQALTNRFSSFFAQGDVHALGWSEHLFEAGVKENLTLFGFHSSFAAPLNGKRCVIWLGFAEQRGDTRFRHLVEDYLRIMEKAFDDHRQVSELQDKYSKEKELSAERTRLLAYAAHDMRSPLNNIKITLAHLQSQGMMTTDSDLLANALQSCHLLDELVDDALDYTRFKAGALQANPKRVRCADIVSRICRGFEQAARDKKLSLMHEIPAELMLIVDVKQFSRMLSNVIGNAIKYTAKGGVIIAARAMEDGRVTISVRDSGIGMSEAEVAAMFDPYVRFGDHAEKGVGLGLALTKVFSDLNNCTMSVSSAPEQGTVVTINAPGVVDDPIRTGAKIFSGKILIADDRPEYTRSLIRSLERFGYQIEIAASIAEASRYLLNEELQYLITDLSFADGDGESLVRLALVKSCVDSVVIASGREVLPAHRDILKRKNVFYVKKPFELTELLAIIGDKMSVPGRDDSSYERRRQSGVSIS